MLCVVVAVTCYAPSGSPKIHAGFHWLCERGSAKFFGRQGACALQCTHLQTTYLLISTIHDRSLHQRSTAVGLVVSGFGLSAFFFSTIAHTAFSDDTSAFLAVLVVGTTIPNVLAYFLVRIVHDDERPGPGKKQRAGYAIIGDVNHDYSPAGLERRLHELNEERRNSDPTYTYPKGTNLPPPHPRQDPPSGWGSTERIRTPSPASSLDLPYFGNTVSRMAGIPLVASSHDLEDMAEHPITRDSSVVRNDSDCDNPLPSNSGDPESIPELLKRRDFWLMCGVITLRKFSSVRLSALYSR